MAKFRLAFTLIELLVIVAIISVIAAMLFPVFAQARGAAKRAQCLNNMRQVGQATMMYANDYDDRFVLVNHQPAEKPNSRNDRTWVQLLLPYVRTYRFFECPSDSTVRPQAESTFDQDLVPGDLYSEYYTASLRSNIGYNFVYLSPIVRVNGGPWMSIPRTISSLPEPSRTLVYVDSVWSDENGTPAGGGSWVVSPPCRYREENGAKIDTFTNSSPAKVSGGSLDVYTYIHGWDVRTETAYLQYGGAWPWHLGRMNIVQADGSARSVGIGQLSDGCNVLPNWEGVIWDDSRYTWLPNG